MLYTMKQNSFGTHLTNHFSSPSPNCLPPSLPPSLPPYIRLYSILIPDPPAPVGLIIRLSAPTPTLTLSFLGV